MQQRKRNWPWIAVVVAVMAGVGLVVALDPDDAEPATAAGEAANGTMGTPITQDGVFEYTVTSLDCDKATVTGATPKGHFCIVGITVGNLGDTARKPGIAFARAYDPRGGAI